MASDLLPRAIGMGRFVVVRWLAPFVLLASLLAWTPGSAAPLARGAAFSASCPDYGGVRICTGQIPSFDGTLLDVDLSLPVAGSGASHPLIVLLHGFGNDKHEWESTTDDADGADKWHWNSHWFASHGFYVLAYTARGFQSQSAQGAQPHTPPGSSRLTSPSATIHLKSIEFEIRDSQWLAALAALALPDLDRSRVAVSGGSYGAGETWLQASMPLWTFPHSVDPRLPILSLQVAVPKYPWTDLAYSLAPNGHGPDLYASAQAGNPTGVIKHSYGAALFARGNATGTFEEGTSTTPSREGPINLLAWFNRMNTLGDPYPDVDPIVAQVRRGLTEFRSAYYQRAAWQAQLGQREVAVFSISGWTDDLFPAVESFRQFKLLKQLDALWPVTVAVGDVGHPRAQNRPEVWHSLNDRAWQFLNEHLSGSHRQRTEVSSLATTCGPGAPSLEPIRASTPEGLAAGTLTVRYATTQTITSVGGMADLNGAATDPIANAVPVPTMGSACRASSGPAIGGFTGVSEPLSQARTYVGLGYVEVPYEFVGTTGQLDARVWDVAPGGGTLLVTRGVYRLDVAGGYDVPSGTLRLPLFGNHWLLQPGHRVRLDLTQVDQPFLRPSNPPSSVTLHDPRLILPTREASSMGLGG